jgi:hypothetical protein
MKPNVKISCWGRPSSLGQGLFVGHGHHKNERIGKQKTHIFLQALHSTLGSHKLVETYDSFIMYGLGLVSITSPKHSYHGSKVCISLILFFFLKGWIGPKVEKGKKKGNVFILLNAYNNNYVHIYNVGDRKSFGQYIYNHVFSTLQLTNLIIASSYKHSGCILIVFFLVNEALFICFVQASKCLEAMVYTKKLSQNDNFNTCNILNFRKRCFDETLL